MVPLPLALMLHLLGELRASADETAFVLGVAAFGAGAFLLLTREDEEEGTDPRREPAPWWPGFEREFRAYVDRSRRVRA